MLFKRHVLEGIARGDVTLAFRRWKRPQIRSGTRLRTAFGEVCIGEVRQIEETAVSEDDARNAGFDVPKQSFVATATAIALFVDGARLPVYLATQYHEIYTIWPLVITATVAAMVGTAFGTRVLGRVPEHTFRRVVAVLLIILGAYMAIAGRG
jgi:putative Ca2+/H+ antiporter (TMEM165/GDT1 family)